MARMSDYREHANAGYKVGYSEGVEDAIYIMQGLIEDVLVELGFGELDRTEVAANLERAISRTDFMEGVDDSRFGK